MDIAKANYKTIDEYIQTFPKDIQEILNTIRTIIHEEAPSVTEMISYKMPAFKLNGKYVIYFGAWKTHLAIYPATSSMGVTKELERYRAGKGTFQFSLDKPLPLSIIRKIVQIRIKEVSK